MHSVGNETYLHMSIAEKMYNTKISKSSFTSVVMLPRTSSSDPKRNSNKIICCVYATDDYSQPI